MKKIVLFIFIFFLSNIFVSKPIFAEEKQIIDWGINYLKADALWDKGITGKNINVAVIDYYIDQEHPDLKENIKDVYNCTYLLKCEKTTILNKEADEVKEHGTQVSGVIAAQDNDIGTKGISYNSNIYFYQINRDYSNIYNALKQILLQNTDTDPNNNIDIVNFSLHYTDEDWNPEIEKVVKELYDTNTILIAAARNVYADKGGKNDPSEEQILYPAKYPEFIAVGNINDKGERYIREDGGSWSATGKELGIVAPGTNVTLINTTDNENKISITNGTSYSAPYVAGLMALYKEIFPHYTNEELKKLLYNNAKKVDYGYIKDGKNYEYGNGIAQANLTSKQLYQGITDDAGGSITSGRKEVRGEEIFDNTINETILQPNDEVKYTFNEIAWDDISHFFLQLQMIKGEFTPFEKTPIKSKEITDFIEKQNITITFYDANDTVIGKEKLTETGWNAFVTPYSNVSSFSIKNEGTEEVLLAEFELHGKSLHTVNKVRTINQTIFFNEGEKKLYDDIKNEGFAYHSFNNLKGTSVQTTKAVGWNKDKKRFDWYQISIPEKGIENLWYKPNDKEINPTYMEGIFDTVEGKIVQSKIGLYSYIYNFNNNIVDYNDTEFRRDRNDYFEYRFKQPVNIDMFFLSIYNKVDLENTTFEFQFLTDKKEVVGTYRVKKEDNVQKIIDLPKRYENVSRILVKNTGNEAIELSELEFFDSKDTNGHMIPKNDVEISNSSNYTYFYDSPTGSSSYKFVETNKTNKNVIKQAYGWISHTQQYAWYLVSNEDFGIQDKWVKNNYSVKMPYQKGLTDTVKGKIIATTGYPSWTDKLLDNQIGSGVLMYGKSSMEYQFTEPVSVTHAFINFEFGYATIPTQLDFTLELLDENRNVILTHQITEDDVFYGYFTLSDIPLTAKGFRLKNNKNDSYPDEFELFE